jgi:hypothetical protein
MGTLSDYIKWRGDLEFWQDGFNTIDNMVLSCISYVPLDGVFEKYGAEVIDIKDVNQIYFEHFHDEKKFREGSILRDAPITLKNIADTNRYRHVKIRNYVSKLELNKTLQFAAMEFLLPDGTSYVAFRGTDDSIVGWKEDFMLALEEVEAERQAVAFLNSIASENDRMLRVGGHSKGGHLAMYATAMCDANIRERILNVYSNDGPGFMEKVAKSKAMKDICPKLISIIPEESIVGLLMEPVGEPIVVKSTALAVAQHNLATWCIEGKQLITTEDVSKAAKFVDQKLKENIYKMSDEELNEFVDNLFSIFEATGAITLSEVKKSGLKGLQAMTKTAGSLTKKIKNSKN